MAQNGIWNSPKIFSYRLVKPFTFGRFLLVSDELDTCDCRGPSQANISREPTPEQIIELQKLQILNNQDYDEYLGMKGEWVWPEEGESQAPPLNNDILDHVLKRMQSMIKPPITNTPPPLFPRFTIRACVLGKTCTGKTACLTRISSVLGVRVLSANTLIQDVLTAYQQEKQTTGEDQMESEWSLKAQRGAAIEKVTRTGKAVPDQILVDIMVDAIRDVPADSGWVLDGFPVNITQAVMLEKALTGAEPDETQQNTHVDKKTPEDLPQPSPALDLVVLLDVSDEQVIERAFSQAVKEESRDQEHNVLEEQKSLTALDTCDPASISTYKSLERDQIQHRISGFHDTWSKLEKWFGAKQNILVKVPAETDEDLLFTNVETILKDTMDSIKQVSATSRSRNRSTSSKHNRDESPRSSGPSPVTPRSAERVYVDESLPQEIPEYLVPYWENVCASYVTNVKMVMQNLRGERKLIIHYLYDIRENFRQHLLKPDLKQEFVSAWQRDYNSVPENMREDEETKGELHQRLDDLRERLWDICDKRRDEAVQERAGVIDDGWLDDHTALLINHYSALMQTEVGRFQDCMYLLRDYYSGMNKALLSQSTCDFIHVPLLDITWNDHMEQETSNISSVSGPSEKHAKNAGKKDTEVEDKKKMFPLVADRSSTNELSKQDLLHPDEKLLQEFYQTTVTAVTSIVSAVIHQRDEGEGDEEQQQQQMETQKAHRQSHTPNVAKDKRKAGKQKGVPPPSQEPSPQPVMENPEEVKRKALRRRIQQEYTDALKHEELAVKMRLELVKSHALKTLCSLQQKTKQMYKNMQDWLEARFLSEMKSIDQMTEIVRQHIENGLQIRHELVLHCTDFCVDGDMRVVPSAPPTPTPPLLEHHSDGTLTVQQLNFFCAHLHKTAPSGLLSGNELTEVLQELRSPHMGSDVLPEPWMHMTSSQVVELVCVFTRDSEMLDWRQFLLSSALPWPFPSRTQLIKTLQSYRAIDTAGTGLITQEQYTQVELWFPSDRDHLVPDDPSAPLPFDRLNNFKKFFFTLFASTDSSSVMLDYMNMLLYFCCHPEPTQGFIRALSLVTEHPLHYKHTSPLVQSVSHIVDAEFDDDEEEGRGAGSDEVGVSVDDVLRVLSHGENRISSHPNRFHMNCRSRDEYREELLKVWKELDFKSEEKIPFSTLSQHPFLQDLMETSSQYLLVDIHKILQTQKTEGDFKS
nr:sperm flagellar protein 2 [Misgurnus anguillicaudatus]